MRSYSAASTPHPARDKSSATPALYDKWFVFAVLSLVVLGLLMMTSASIVISDKQWHQPFYYLFKQLVFLTLGVLLGSAVVQIEIAQWEKYGGYLLVGVLLLLALVLIPGIGHSANGSARWIGYGPLTFQVSELTKFSMVVYMAGYLVRRNVEIRTQLSGFLKPMFVLGTIAVLLLKEPDFGATVVVTATTLGMMFLAGMRLSMFAGLFTLVIAALGVIAISAPYRLARLTSFLNPWARPFDTGYQLTQSLIAFGRGGWWGTGLGKSIQKMFYLPEAHTDFLFAVIAEELGVFGMLLVISLFLLLVVRIFLMGQRAQKLGNHFAGFVAYGFGLWITIQFTVSIGVNSGLLPTKGLTLPLMSYGGSSVLISCIVIAVLLRIDHENRLNTLGIR
ncbi:putative lipid II flippase FtsW [Aquicella lusitana]|uniref:Probable peptidoglycan glycosyltransferase FtsW n=1 Tax=Aquicella lusitana TaxID=254246 RepID=A0A370GM21_9COXI|nr:putative lipid II flippase FtsW [Aquicella lusitana]RDI44775.1 cell division-specific peptidoglycan biosynthesis regulator FtsW [Aquicella lusitana]VVC72972.1 Lipid II flippase FtsW [Aquicella lusitana]